MANIKPLPKASVLSYDTIQKLVQLKLKDLADYVNEVESQDVCADIWRNYHSRLRSHFWFAIIFNKFQILHLQSSFKICLVMSRLDYDYLADIKLY